MTQAFFSGNSERAPIFSVVTATFNCGGMLRRTLEALKSQTFADFEWIVIDGASCDDTVDVIRGAGSLVTAWISEPDRGIADAWNKGIALARGTHVVILNAGDLYDPNFLEVMARHIDGQRIACAHARLATETGRIVGLIRSEPGRLGRGMHLAHNWCAVPRSIYESQGLYRELSLAMDFDWFHRYFRRFGSAGFRVVDAVLGTYYMGGTSDVKYAESFRMNERILLANGACHLIARGVRCWYQMKHSVRRLTGGSNRS